MKTFATTAAAAAAAALVLASCGSDEDGGNGTINGGPDGAPGVELSAEELAIELSQRVGQDTGIFPETAECEGGLPAEVDTQVRCVISDGQENYGVTVTVTNVTETGIDYDYLIDEGPEGGTPDGDPAGELPGEDPMDDEGR